ncbi:MAG: SAM-dependent methyltransferase, partial [Candidatus Omnitrophica bacterium]|nr:SAM-dependent methyltransferase [Candidatus Omnitrophota bacterium]
MGKEIKEKVILRGREKMLNKKQESFSIFPIGYIRRAKYGIQLRILEPFRPALKQLDHFSHAIVLWWADRFDNERYRTRLQTKPPYAKKILTGVFACRSPVRPNP